MKKQQTTDRPLVKAPTYADVARLIVPKDTPEWLPAQLEWWAQGLGHDRMADNLRPTKAETRERLVAIREASRLLQRELNVPAIRSLLDTAKAPRITSISTFDMRDLAERATLACSSPLLMGATGETKRGRGKPKVPGVFDPKVLCAARVVELWRHFRGGEPGVGNLKAAAVAQAYWRASGGRSTGYGDPLNGWYAHFRVVRENKKTASLMGLRLMWRRDLEQTVSRGRPPWYEGTYFPPPKAKFRSSGTA